MANRERTVDLVVRARDGFSSTFKKLEAARKLAAKRDTIRGDISKTADEYKQLSSQLDRYNAAISSGRKNNTLTASELAEVADSAKLVRERMRESVTAIEAQNVALNKARRMAGSGFAVFDRRATILEKEAAATRKATAAMAEQTSVAGRLATALNKLNLPPRTPGGAMLSDAPGGNYIAQEYRRRSAVAEALAQSYKDDADRIAAAAQASEARIIAAEVEWIRGGRRGNRPTRGDSGGRKGEDQDVELYGLKPYQMVNLGYQVNDVIGGLAMGQAPVQILAQQAGQFAQIWPQMMVGLVRSIPQIAAVTAVLAPFIDAVIRVRTEANSIAFFSDQLTLLADGGRYSAESLAANAREMQKLGVAIEDARQISLAFIKDGISGDEMVPLVQMAKQLADLTGITVPEAAEKLSSAFNGNVDDVRALDQELQFLTAEQLTQIRAMENAGDAAGALSTAQNILRGRLADTVAPASEWEQALDDLTYSWNELVQAITDSGVIELGASALGVLAQSARNWAKFIKEATGEIKKAVEEPTDIDLVQRLSAERARLNQLIAQSERADQTMFGPDARDSGETLRLKALLKGVQAEYDTIIEQMRTRVDLEEDVTELAEVTVSESEEQKKLQVDIDAILNGQLDKLREEAELASLTSREQFIENTLLDARNEALERANELGIEFLGLTEEQTRLLREQAGLTFDRGEAGKTLTSGMSGLVDKIIGVESGGNASAKNPLSSATGLGQFISSTWLAMFKKYFPDRAASMTEAAILALRKDSEISRQMVELYARENAAVLQKAGIATTDAALYLAHFLGPQGALSILSAQGGTAVSSILGADQINANKSILEGKTAAEVVAWAEKKMGISQSELGIQTRLGELDAERVKNEKEYLDAYRARIVAQNFELSTATLEARQAAIAKALREEELIAQQVGLTLTKEQRAEIEKTAAAAFDRQNVEVEVNRLLEQRSLLLESLEIAQAAGDSGKVTEIVGQINTTEAALQTAIQQAIAFWQSMGGPGAEAAILKLEQLRDGIGDVIEDMETRFLPNAESINERLADIGSNAFSAMAEAIANGTNVAQAFFQTLLQGIGEFLIEIGKAIVKQALFNAISGGASGGGAGGFLSGIIGGLFHSGGVIGRSGGSGSRMVNPAVFAGAQRFHNGGVLGLGPNEVPIIGLKDEEMVTRDDPRHVMNGGAAGSTTSVKNVIVFDPAEMLEAALATEPGEQVMITFASRRPRQFKQALGL